MRDLVQYVPDFGLNDVSLLKVGRHFRLSPTAKAISGRNESENKRIVALSRPGDLLFEVQGWASPVTLLRGKPDSAESEIAAAITVRYSDAAGPAVVRYGPEDAVLSDEIRTMPLSERMLDILRI
jgi:hypothetical protein